MLVGVVAVLFNDADPDQMVNDLLGFFFAHGVALGQLFCGQTDAALLERKHEFDFFLGQKAIKDPEIHVVFLHFARQLARNGVCDEYGKLFDELCLFRVVAMMGVHRIVTFVDVDVGVDFFYHNIPLIRSGS